jgi:hypothetical protein
MPLRSALAEMVASNEITEDKALEIARAQARRGFSLDRRRAALVSNMAETRASARALIGVEPQRQLVLYQVTGEFLFGFVQIFF